MRGRPMIVVWKPMFRLAIHSAVMVFAVWPVTAAPEIREAPNAGAVAVDQLCVSGNACGPAALLNALRFGNGDWQRAANAVAGANDKERILRVIREIGMRPSKQIPGVTRWSRRGVGLSDLRDMGDEMTIGQYLPQLREEVFFINPRETPEQLLRRVHQRMETSLAKGLPPVVSLRRFKLGKSASPVADWVAVDAHFVTLTAIPRKLDKQARGFDVGYIDPWGGRKCQGVIRLPVGTAFADATGRVCCLEAEFPRTLVGKNRVGKSEATILAVSAAIGRW